MSTQRHGGRQGPNKPGKDRVLPRLRDSRVYTDPNDIQRVRSIEARNANNYAGPEGAPVPPTEYTVSKVSVSLARAAGDAAYAIVTNTGGLFR